MSFCVAGVALPDIVSANVSKIVLCGWRNTFASLQELNMICNFRGKRNTLKTAIVILRGQRSTSNVSCSVFFADRIVRAASSGATQHSTLHTLHFTLHTLHSTLYTSHSQHFILFTPHSTLFTTRFTLPFSSLRTMIPGFVIIHVSIRVRGLHLVFVRDVKRKTALRITWDLFRSSQK